MSKRSKRIKKGKKWGKNHNKKNTNKRNLNKDGVNKQNVRWVGEHKVSGNKKGDKPKRLTGDQKPVNYNQKPINHQAPIKHNFSLGSESRDSHIEYRQPGRAGAIGAAVAVVFVMYALFAFNVFVLDHTMATAMAAGEPGNCMDVCMQDLNACTSGTQPICDNCLSRPGLPDNPTTCTACGMDGDGDGNNCDSWENEVDCPEDCSCVPDCAGNVCGDDGCGGSCGTCDPGNSCEVGQCVCVPDCTGNVCGDDGCGTPCTCDSGYSCVAESCVADCIPDCAGNVCGDDGCGTPCTCDSGYVCESDVCEVDTCEDDADEDGYNDEDGECAGANDCNDNNAAINPGATEVCDGLDNDCDGEADEGGICCGNGAIDSGEDCDGSLLGEMSCYKLLFDSGALGCAADCSFDILNCVTDELCGDDVLGGPEKCDGIPTKDCNDFDLGPGTVYCSDDCLDFDISGCGDPISDDDTNDETGSPDTGSTGETDCSNQLDDDGDGDVDCDDDDCAASLDCMFCGNGFVEGSEQCDGSNLAGETCKKRNYDLGGTLSCGDDCKFDTSDCEISVDVTEDMASDAIQKASNEIESAKAQNRNTAVAEGLLIEARDSFSANTPDYVSAKIKAEEAIGAIGDYALGSGEGFIDSTQLIVIVVVLLVILVAVVMIRKRGFGKKKDNKKKEYLEPESSAEQETAGTEEQTEQQEVEEPVQEEATVEETTPENDDEYEGPTE